MWGNLVLAASNLYGGAGALRYFAAGMRVHGGLLFASVLSAVARHLVETGHHGLPGVGLGVSPEGQEQWARLTVAVDLALALATTLVFRVDRLYLLGFLAAGFACLALPEIVSRCELLGPEADQVFYVVAHSAGHLLIYHTWNGVAASMPPLGPAPC